MIKKLGKGTYSHVYECVPFGGKNKKKRDETQRFAVKILRNTNKYRLSARTELQVLTAIRRYDPTNISCCIHIIESCQYLKHPIFLFPVLGQSLYNFMAHNKNKPFCNDDYVWDIP